MTPDTLPAGPPGPGPTQLTARSPVDLIAASAVVLGFWPSESVVMLTFDATHPFHARVDLPDDARAMRALADTLVRPALQHRVGRVVLLVHTDHPRRAADAWRALRTVFRRHDVPIIEALHVGPERWFPLQGGDHDLRRRGVPLDRGALDVHPFLAQAVVDGRVLRGSRTELAESLAPDAAGVARVAALAAHTEPPADLATRAGRLAEGTWVHATVRRLLATGATASDDDATRLLRGMRELRVRDAAWSAIDRAAARSAAALFADLVRRAPDDLVAAPAGVLAWAAWQSGDGALAWCAIERCEQVEPDHGLARLVAEALERAVPPSVWDDGFDWKEGL
ncbi:DUF4192 domain-containing protein [Nocardioides sp. C4-1]|uniref:DUF4192 domain-containing protein n=1 Tax=Nocardioides sp. C4-1 TaxID=3151851 RepID=UPI003265F8BE